VQLCVLGSERATEAAEVGGGHLGDLDVELEGQRLVPLDQGQSALDHLQSERAAELQRVLVERFGKPAGCGDLAWRQRRAAEGSDHRGVRRKHGCAKRARRVTHGGSLQLLRAVP